MKPLTGALFVFIIVAAGIHSSSCTGIADILFNHGAEMHDPCSSSYLNNVAYGDLPDGPNAVCVWSKCGDLGINAACACKSLVDTEKFGDGPWRHTLKTQKMCEGGHTTQRWCCKAQA